MSKSSRRIFLLTSSGALAGTLISPAFVQAENQNQKSSETKDFFSQSGLVTGQKKRLNYQSIPGFLSAEQLSPHFEAHYGGALKGYMSADDKLQSSIVSGEEMDSSSYGALQRARTTKSNSVVLHELYFEGMSENSCNLMPEVKSALEKRFGTVEKWATDFQACAKASSGWAILAFHPVNGKLYNVISDTHATGVNWMATPLLLLICMSMLIILITKTRKRLYRKVYGTH